VIRNITPELRRFIYSSANRPSDDIDATPWDACVVGSGPGGAVAAATLAQAGWRVLLVERGGFRPPEELNFRVLDTTMRLGHLELTTGARAALHQGNALGGSSLIFGAVAMQPPSFVFDEWARSSGVDSISAESLAPHYAYVGDVMSVTRQTADLENRSNAIVRQMAAALGRPDGLELVQRYTRGCRGTGLCNLGCGFDLKGTMTNSFLPLALETGNLTVLTECAAVRFEGQASGRRFRAGALHTVLRDFSTGAVVARPTIRARHFILAPGAFFSSALLMQTRAIARRPVGRKVWLQPHAVVYALFDEPVTMRGRVEAGRHLPFNGVPAIYNFTGMLRERRYSWFASVLHPASLATYAAHLPPDEHLALMSRFHHTTGVTITLRDDPERSRVVMRGGRPRLDFRESRSDRESLRRCFLDAAQALLAVGARRVFLPMLRPPRIERESDLREIERIKMSYDRLLIYSDHTSGGNSLGADPGQGVTSRDGRVFGSENVYVTDSSLFPSACGVSPSWTIMALSRMVASRLAAVG
jgi:choline dehydrogenase-like flavoprotein